MQLWRLNLLDEPRRQNRRAPRRLTPVALRVTALVGLLAAVLLAALFTSAGRAQAHGQGSTIVVFRGVTGAYYVEVEVQPVRPVVGSVHISVIPHERATSRPVLDAAITVYAVDEDGEPVYKAPALLTPGSDETSPPYYDANITFRKAANWILRVQLEHDTIGPASLDTPLRIGRQPLLPGLEGTLVFVLATGAIVSGVVYLWFRSRRLRRSAEG